MLTSISLKRISPFVRDISITSLTAIITAICNVFLIRIISNAFGADELGVYTLVRRTVATLIPFTSLSIGIGIARYIALYTGKGEKTESVLPAAATVSLTCSLLVCLALLPFSELFSECIFDEKGRSNLFDSILFLLVGENLFVCLYAYYRGRQQILSANIWSAFILGIMPVSITLLIIYIGIANNVNYIIWGIGSLFYLSLFNLLPKIAFGLRSITVKEFKSTAAKLLAYSIPRAPGGMALTLIFTFGVLVSPYTGGIANAAYMSIGIWIFQLFQTATDSFGMVVLPKVANLLGRGNEDYLIDKLRSIYDLIMHVGLFIVIQLFLVVDFLIFVWLGIEYSDAVPIARIVILAMMPFLFFSMMRNIIDAVEKRAVNTINTYLSLFITIVISLLLMKLGMGLVALAVGFDTGLILLGILTYIYMNRRYHIKLLSNNFYSILLINMMMGLFIYLVKNKMMSNYFSYQNVVIVVLAQLLCGILYMFILSKLDATWIRDIEERIVRRCHN